MTEPSGAAVLRVEDLHVRFRIPGGALRAVLARSVLIAIVAVIQKASGGGRIYGFWQPQHADLTEIIGSASEWLQQSFRTKEGRR